jgi:hypothetical protein
MFRKMMFALCIIVTLSLLGSGLTLASEGLPTWEIAFDPGPFMPEPYYFIHAVEEFKGDLYTVVGDPIWFNSDDGRDSAGQVFRSPDGKNWEPASDLGFGLGAVEDGCGNNYYDTSQDMVVFKNKLYLIPSEICYLRPGVILRSRNGVTWESVATTEEFGKTWTFDVDYYGQFYKLAAFKGMLYVNLVYYDPNTEFVASAIFRSPSGNPGTWEQMMEFPGWNRPGSFHVFKDALYVASDNVISLPDWAEAPEQIWRSFDGVNWEMVVGDGFGYSPVDGLGGFADYKGYLYVGTGTIDTSSGLVGQLWRSRDGLHWKQVDISSLLSQNDVKVDGGFVYHGKLYIYTVNYIEGGSVFRTKDAKTWERVNEPGWGNPTWLTTHLASDQVVFKDDLYMGVVGPQGVLLKMVHPDK